MRSKRRVTRTPTRRRKSAGSGWLEIRSDGLTILQAAQLARVPWLLHAFTTRPGGASLIGGQPVLNLGFTEWDTREGVLANRARLLAALCAGDMKLITLHQRHTDIVHVLDQSPKETLHGDALITRIPGLLLAVQTADCVPILLADPRRRAVAVVHAGWRGTLRRIAAKAVNQMRADFGSDPSNVIAALGPEIGKCCYEVGREVAQEFASQFAMAREWFDGPFDLLAAGAERIPLKWLTGAPPGHDPPPPRVWLDLAAANRWQLLDAGLRARNISATSLCTSCRADLLFSHRREEGHTGRQMGLIGIRPGTK